MQRSINNTGLWTLALSAMLLAALAPQLASFAQGSLTPPGPPAPAMKTLAQIEPRTPISSAPFTISSPGSYYLTTNLTVKAGNNGIIVAARDVTLDLGGFVLAGGGSDNGVYVSGACSNLVIRDGVVRDWESCVEAETAVNSRFERLQVSGGKFWGLYVGDGNLVLSCQATACDWGLFAGNDCTIKNCTATGNTSAGIYVLSGGTVVDCTASRNFTGIEADESSTIQFCTVRSNAPSNGIQAGQGCTVLGCTAEYNASHGISADRSIVRNCTSSLNTGNGIDVFINCHAEGNTCVDNGINGDGAGINSRQGGNCLEGNSVAGNSRGIDCNPSTGNLIINNRANSNGTDYDIGAGNHSGAVISAPGVGFTNANPWANFRF